MGLSVNMEVAILQYKNYKIISDKLVVTHLVKTFPAFYGTQMFITVFTRSHHWSL